MFHSHTSIDIIHKSASYQSTCITFCSILSALLCSSLSLLSNSSCAVKIKSTEQLISTRCIIIIIYYRAKIIKIEWTVSVHWVHPKITIHSIQRNQCASRTTTAKIKQEAQTDCTVPCVDVFGSIICLPTVHLTLKEPGFLDPSHSRGGGEFCPPQDHGNRLTKHQVCGTSG